MAYRTGANGESVLKPNARCSLDTANALLAAREKRFLPAITLIHNCPILTEHGVLRKGYHSVCGGRIIKSAVVPEEMSLKEARKILLEAIAEFDFLEAFGQITGDCGNYLASVEVRRTFESAFSTVYGRSRSFNRWQWFPSSN